MKDYAMKIVFTILIISIYSCVFSQTVSRQNNEITFTVSKVKLAENVLKEVSYKSALETRLNLLIESYLVSEKKRNLIETNAHAFISTLHIGFAQHRPVVISPDMIWLLIVQGAAQHINFKSDSLKESIVNFKTRKKISVRRDKFIKGNENNNWASVFPEFTDSIKSYLRDSLYNLFIPSFSTTGVKEKSAYEIAFMGAVNSYFDYSVYTFCGIPEITLEGSTEDWQWIAKNSSKLSKIGMTDWSNNIKPILNEFVNASKGKIDTTFWKSMYKWLDLSGGTKITGWIIKFFPYIYSNNQLIANPFIYGNRYAYSGLFPNNIPTGLSKVDMNWQYFNQSFKMELYSGFVGISQNKKSKAIRPEISWAIRDINSEKKTQYKPQRDTIINNDTILIIEEIHEDENEYLTLLDTLYAKNLDIDIDYIIEINFVTELGRRMFKYQKKRYELANLFPNKCNNFEESIAELNTYISGKFSNKQINYKAEVEFYITWFGAIDKVKIIKSNKPKYNTQIISIIENIKSCDSKGNNTKIIINLDLK
jgi:hypothetical protein